MATPYQNLGQQLGGLVGLLGDQTDSSAYIEGRRGGYAVQKAMEEASRARNQRIISDQRVEMRNRLATAMPADGTQGQPGADILGDVYGDAAPLVRAITLANETVDLDRAGPLAKPGAAPESTTQRHLGGSLTWFLRGTARPAGSVWACTAPVALLDGLDALFDGPAASPANQAGGRA